jgi:GNAT superfamily N-acetyltransferase
MTVAGGDPEFHIRLATPADAAAMERLIDRSVHGLQAGDYSSAQRQAALGAVFAVDPQLIEDGTYFVVEHRAGRLAGCGGWSFRQKTHGADDGAALIDPARDAARIRAFFVDPDFARQGVGGLIMRTCEAAAMEAGFRSLELTATLTGVHLYAHSGFVAEREFDVPLSGGETLPVVLMRKQI